MLFTVNLLERSSDLLVTHIDLLRKAIRSIRAQWPFHIDACVVLLVICIAFGRYREATMTFSSRLPRSKIFQQALTERSIYPQCGPTVMNAGSGKDGFRSTLYMGKVITPTISITPTSIRSNIAMSAV